MNTDYKYLKIELSDGICTLTLNREDKLNALNREVIGELRSFLENIHEDCNIKGLIFTGAGNKAFIAGADIKEMTDLTVEQAKTFAYEGQQVSLLLEEARVPVIAAVNGFALGGGLEMALACDFIMATNSAKFGLPEVSLGLIPGFGGTQRLAKVVGRNRAKELIYSGRMIETDEAKSIGLCIESFDSKDELLNCAKEKMKTILNNSPYAIAEAKFVINRGVDLPTEDGLDFEKEHFGQIFESEDMKEGTSAFVEKRKANFTGK